jgi:membrane protein involved in colicin uptake
MLSKNYEGKVGEKVIIDREARAKATEEARKAAEKRKAELDAMFEESGQAARESARRQVFGGLTAEQASSLGQSSLGASQQSTLDSLMPKSTLDKILGNNQ